MCGSGRRIGMRRTTTATVRRKTRKGRSRARCAWRAAVRGSVRKTTAGPIAWAFGGRVRQTRPSITSVSAAPRMFVSAPGTSLDTDKNGVLIMREPFRHQEGNDTRTVLLALAVGTLLVAALSACIAAHEKETALAPSASSAQRGKSGSEAPKIAPADAEVAPDFALKDIAGNEVRLSDYRGKVVALNFWATWCGPCKLETPWLVELREQYHKQGFEII